MSLYRVSIAAKKSCNLEYEVEASSQKEALKKALEMGEGEGVIDDDWSNDVSFDIVNVSKVKPSTSGVYIEKLGAS